MYVAGCFELHALADNYVDTVNVPGLKGLLKVDMEKTRAEYKSLQQLIGNRGPTKSQDLDVEIPEGLIQHEHVTNTLNAHKWPPCFSRPNVTPDHAPYISAFPIGIVLNYSKGLCCSRTMKAWPRLSHLLTTWFAQQMPEFKFTTIQLNRNYGAKMHVDGNNHGLSAIMALGDYTGGELWLYDPEEGTDEMEVKDNLRGYPELKVGMKVRGKKLSIKHVFILFDGNRPHAVFPFNGTRMSLVFFTRKNWMKMDANCRQAALENGFNIPDADYMACGTDQQKAVSVGPGGAINKRPEDVTQWWRPTTRHNPLQRRIRSRSTSRIRCS